MSILILNYILELGLRKTCHLQFLQLAQMVWYLEMVIECPKDITMLRLNIFEEPMRCNEHINTMKATLSYVMMFPGR
mgnify:CR=1 FL=1